MEIKEKISAVDLFCGIGGLSYGLEQVGISVKAGIDIDESCRYTYETNCNTEFINKDIQDLGGTELSSLYGKNDIRILVGCAPCQPFSSYTYKKDKDKDGSWQLLYEFSRLVKETEPVIVSMENVPTLLNFKEAPVFYDFVDSLKQKGYHVWYKIIYSPDYGIPVLRQFR